MLLGVACCAPEHHLRGLPTSSQPSHPSDDAHLAIPVHPRAPSRLLVQGAACSDCASRHVGHAVRRPARTLGSAGPYAAAIRARLHTGSGSTGLGAAEGLECLTARQWRQRAGRRAVKLDQRARRWADSLLDVLVPSSRLARPVPPRQLDFRSRIHLLRASPLPSFLRSVTDLFNLSSKPEHWRPTLSKHDLANAVFALDEQALQGAVGQEPRGGSSAVMRERERRKVGEKGRRWVEQRLGEMERERAGAAGHDEL